MIFFHHVEHKNDSFCVHPLGNSQRVLTKGVGQRGTLRLKSSHFKHNVGGSQGLPDKPFPQGSHEQDVNNARKKRAEHSAEASRRKLDHESTQRIVRGQENKLLLLEGGPWMRALRIVFGLLIAVVCACTVPPRAFAAGRGSNGATISKVTVGEKGAPEKAQPFEIKGNSLHDASMTPSSWVLVLKSRSL